MTRANDNTRIQTQPGDIFDALREGFAFVAAQAENVYIDNTRLAAFTAVLPSKPPGNVLDVTHHYVGRPEDTAAYILTLDAINFGSGYRPHLVDEGWQMVGNSLYFTISTRLKEWYEQRGPLSARKLGEAEPDLVASILGLDVSKKWSAEFAGICALNMQELGGLIGDGFDGYFTGLIEEAHGSAAYVVETLSRLPNYRDVHSYKGRDVAFLKRAQITAADLHIAFARLGKTLFDDIDRLTMFPDNAVPHALHVEGVLAYAPGLSSRIASGHEIASGAAEEVEIRACAAHAVELIAAQKGIKAMDVDHILWHRSEEDPRYSASPTHRTISRFY
jgi:hypothetical protein